MTNHQTKQPIDQQTNTRILNLQKCLFRQWVNALFVNCLYNYKLYELLFQNLRAFPLYVLVFFVLTWMIKTQEANPVQFCCLLLLLMINFCYHNPVLWIFIRIILLLSSCLLAETETEKRKNKPPKYAPKYPCHVKMVGKHIFCNIIAIFL